MILLQPFNQENYSSFVHNYATFLSLILCFTMGFLWHIDNLLSERKELCCEIFPLFSNLIVPLVFLTFKLLISLTCCSKNRFISVQLTSSQRSIMWSIKNTMTTVVHYLMQLINAFKICFEIIFPLLSET